MIYRIKIENYVLKVKERHRDSRNGKKYSPCACKERSLAWEVQKKFLDDYQGVEMLTGKLVLIIEAHYKGVYRGDGDNYTKFISDALQKACVVKNDWSFREQAIRIVENSSENCLYLTIAPFDENGWFSAENASLSAK